MSLIRRLRWLFAVTTSFIPMALGAQAFGLNEIGSCAVSRGYAVAASPCRDASTIFWNSAAATWLNGWNVTGGVAAVAVKASFTQDTTLRRWNATVPTEYIPHLFINYHDPNSSAAYGLGVYVPYGLTSQWPDDFPGKFEALKASLSTVYVQPNFAWKLTPTWSIGGGPIWGHSNVELIQSIDLSQQLTPTGATFGQLGIASGTEFAQVKLKGSSNGLGAQVALAGQLTTNIHFGIRYLSPITFKYNNANATFTQIPTNLIVGGDLPGPTAATSIKAGTPVDAVVASQFAAGGALVAQNASTKITHPSQAQVGLSYTRYKNWLLEADYAWVGWNSFGSLPVTFTNPLLSKSLIEDYKNSSAIRLGAEYTIPTDGWHLRAGFTGIQSAAPAESVTPLLPEQDRTYWTGGVGIPFSKMWAVDAAYAHVATPGSRGRIVERTVQSQTAAQLNGGVYALSANVFSLTIKATF